MPDADVAPFVPVPEGRPVTTGVAADGEPVRWPMFGPYRLEELIGRGGMGEVYRAYDTARGRVVALKRLPTALAADPLFQARFRAEAALAARLHEPHVIPVHDFGEIDGQLYIDMRLVDGPDLAALLTSGGPLPPRRAVDIVTQVAAALDAAHAAGLVHRDIKPGNILLAGRWAGEEAGADTGADYVYVADFGIARVVDGSGSSSLTSTGKMVGSLDYIAPERFSDGHGDRRVDVYALGCVLYEALTAERPFPVVGLPAMINAHLNTPPPAPSARRRDLPAGLDAVVARAMAKEPDDRYPTAGALAAHARRVLAGSGAAPASGVLPPAPVAMTIDGRELLGTAATVVVPSPIAAPAWAAPVGPAAHAAATFVPPPVGPGPGPAGAAPRSPRRRRRVVLAVAVVVAVLACAVTAVRLLPSSGSSTGIVTEPYASTGTDPFMPPVTTRPPTAVDAVATGGTVSGATADLYGGTLNDAACDPGQMVTFLQGHPSQARAWAEVEGIGVTELPGYVRGLTPVLLRADTAVTNHGFADGAATTLRSVLQAGTAVLVDRYGVPRARCYCGNPLTPASPLSSSPSDYTGERWSRFDPARVVVVAPAAAPIAELTLLDVASGQSFLRPVGGDGRSDRPSTAVPPSTATAEPSSTPFTLLPDSSGGGGWVNGATRPSAKPSSGGGSGVVPPPITSTTVDRPPSVGPPGPVAGLTSVAHNDSGSYHVDTDWQPPADPRGTEITSYQITASVGGQTQVVTSPHFVDRDRDHNCAQNLSYTVRAIGRAPGGGASTIGDPARVAVRAVLNCTPSVAIVSATASGPQQVTVVIRCSGGGRGGQSTSDLAVLLDGATRWTDVCAYRLGGGAVGSSDYTAVIDDVPSGEHRVTATSSTISGTESAGPVPVTVS